MIPDLMCLSHEETSCVYGCKVVEDRVKEMMSDLGLMPCMVVDMDVYDKVTADNTNVTAGLDDEPRTSGDTGPCMLSMYPKNRSCVSNRKYPYGATGNYDDRRSEDWFVSNSPESSELNDMAETEGSGTANSLYPLHWEDPLHSRFDDAVKPSGKVSLPDG